MGWYSEHYSRENRERVRKETFPNWKLETQVTEIEPKEDSSYQENIIEIDETELNDFNKSTDSFEIKEERSKPKDILETQGHLISVFLGILTFIIVKVLTNSWGFFSWIASAIMGFIVIFVLTLLLEKEEEKE